MYIELVTTVAAVQNDLANAYASSGRLPEIGLYFLAMNQATVEFFKYVDPPKQMQVVHQAFLEWQEAGIAALKQQLESDKPVDTKTTKRHVKSSEAFAAALAEFTAPGEAAG